MRKQLVSVNNIYARNADFLKKTLEEGVTSQENPLGCNTIKSLIDHEFGHQLDNLLKTSKNKNIIDLYNSLSNEEITNGLSKYAWDNHNTPFREFVAEGWAEYRNNPPQTVRPIAKQIGEIIEREYQLRYGSR